MRDKSVGLVAAVIGSGVRGSMQEISGVPDGSSASWPGILVERLIHEIS